MINSSGVISFQANGSSDIFFKTEVRASATEESDEAVLGVEDIEFESEQVAVTGKSPRFKSVNIPGDTTVIHAWYQSRLLVGPFALRVYIEYEEAEQLIDEQDDSEITVAQDTDLDSNEIHL
jgi:hypothetical protein